MDSIFPNKEANDGQTGNYITCSEVRNLIKDSFKAAVEVPTRWIVTVILEEMIEDAFKVGCDKQKEGIKAPVRNKVEGDSIHIFIDKQVTYISFGVQSEQLAKSNGFIDSLT